MAIPKTADGAIEALRILKIARDTAVKARTTAMITLKATLVTADDELRFSPPPTPATVTTPPGVLGTVGGSRAQHPSR